MGAETSITCDGCGAFGGTGPHKSALLGSLYRVGWSKGGASGRHFCPRCVCLAMDEREKREKRGKRG